MPVIPTKDSISKVIPTPPPYVPHAFHSAGAVGRGIAAIGAALQGFGADQQRKEDALDLIKAEAEQRKGLLEIQRNLMTDPNYQSYDQRFGEASQALTDRTMGMIRNPGNRERWGAKSLVENEEMRNRILNHGMDLKRQDEEASLGDALDNHLSIYTSPTSTPEVKRNAKKSMDDAVSVAVNSGVINPIKARKLLREYKGIATEQDIRQRISMALESGESLDNILADINSGGSTATDATLGLISRNETGAPDVLKGVAKYAVDSKGSISYGNLGLNSMGSAQEFVAKYGAQFGLTAKPGTPEFNKQWVNAARAAPVELHAAEADWFNERIAPRITSDLQSLGLSEDIASDDRVKAYFADRMIQYGPESIKTYGRRISEAISNATDAESFMSAMSQLDRNNLSTDFRSAIATVPKNKQRYLQGLGNRITKREDGALSVVDDGGTYSDLSPNKRAALSNIATSAFRAEALKRIDNAVSELTTTGQMSSDANGVFPLDFAKKTLTNSQFQKAKDKITVAGAEYAAVSKLHDMSEADATEWVGRLDPATADKNKYPIQGMPIDEYYASAERIHDKAQKKLDGIIKQREKDPAQSVENSAEVIDAKTKLKNFGKNIPVVTMNETIVAARIAAQTRLGIPENLQRVVTNREAAMILQLPKRTTPDDVDAAMAGANERAKAIFGKYAEQALRSAINLRIQSQASADEARDLIVGEPEPAAKKEEGGWFDSLWGMFGSSVKQSDVKAQPKVPSDAQINWALQDPEKRSVVFDQKFGKGAFSKIFAERIMNQQKGKQ